jgi:CubicO group peptidase (beta-lactamase class C family)
MVAVAALTHVPPATAQDITSTLDAIAAKARESRNLPGLSVAVRLGDRVLLAKGYGQADLENRGPATAETVYHIGSITRPITAAAVLKLVSQGRLRLDDAVTSRVPAFSLKAPGVTLRHLLTHTSGIHRERTGAGSTQQPSLAVCRLTRDGTDGAGNHERRGSSLPLGRRWLHSCSWFTQADANG